MCQHDFYGRRLFQHRNTDKWDLLLQNRRVKGFRFEEECLGHIKRLRTLWDGRVSRIGKGKLKSLRNHRRDRKPTIQAVMLSFEEHRELREQTLENLSNTDWDAPIQVHIENGEMETDKPRQTRGAYLALKKSLEINSDYVLFIKDALKFNRHLRHNLQDWRPLRAGLQGLASLYNPNVYEAACDTRTNTRIVAAELAFGTEAFVMSRGGVERALRRWHFLEKSSEFELRRVAKIVGTPVLYHAPSLAQPAGTQGSEKPRPAIDFDPVWKA
jgi:hypothetical protein